MYKNRFVEKYRPKKAAYDKTASKYYKKRFKKKAALSVPRSLNRNLAPPVLPVKFKSKKLNYWDIVSWNTGISTMGGYVYSANGMYDPDITGTGHQLMGFDQLMLWYEHYTVTYAKITVTFINNDTNDNLCVGILAAPDTSLSTDTGRTIENGMLVRKYLSPYGVGNDNYRCTLSLGCDISKINGRKDVRQEEQFRGTSAANPAEQSYFHLFSFCPTSANQVGCYADVTLEFDAVFTEPKKLTQS